MTKRRPKGPNDELARVRESQEAELNGLLKAIGERVLDLRSRLALSQKQVGERAGVTGTYIYMVEGGGQNLTVGSLARIAAALEVPIRDLFPDDPAAPVSNQALERLSAAFERISVTMSTYVDATAKQHQQATEFVEVVRRLGPLGEHVLAALKAEHGKDKGRAGGPPSS